MGEKKNPPRLDFMIGMLSVIVRSCATEAAPELGRPPSHLPGSAVLHLPNQDKELLYSNTFWKVCLVSVFVRREASFTVLFCC